jgi:hypothetical protein
MAQQLRKKHEYSDWFEAFRIHYGILADYTHGHLRQLSRWISPGEISANYSAGQAIEILEHSDVIGLLGAIERERTLNRPTEHLFHKMLSVIHASQSSRSSANGS